MAPHTKIGTLSRVLSLMAFAFSATALAGYAFQSPILYHWKPDQTNIPVALPTAIILFIISMNILMITERLEKLHWLENKYPELMNQIKQ